jgi:DNA-binding response OmpR family regulator
MPRILILEPYLPTGQALAIIFKRDGWDVTLSQTDQDTLAALQHCDYDALLVDLDMTTGDGWRCLQALSLTGHSAPIVAMIGQESDLRQRAEALGARIMLPKPVGRKRLLTGVAAVLKES